MVVCGLCSIEKLILKFVLGRFGNFRLLVCMWFILLISLVGRIVLLFVCNVFSIVSMLLVVLIILVLFDGNVCVFSVCDGEYVMLMNFLMMGIVLFLVSWCGCGVLLMYGVVSCVGLCVMNVVLCMLSGCSMSVLIVLGSGML